MPLEVWETTSDKQWSSFCSAFAAMPFPPWSTITEIVRDKGCQLCFEEPWYIDLDFRSEFSAFHSRRFDPGPSVTRRLHFFDVSSAQVTQDIPSGLELFQENYLGFSVQRPLDYYRVGRTLIKPPSFRGHGQLTCCEAFPVHIGGDVLHIHAMPYIQQDGIVMRCAQACLWMAGRYMHQKYGFPLWLPSEITQIATQHNHRERPLPSGGLIVDQVAHALHCFGLQPVAYRQSVTASTETIAAYVDSGIPVFCSIKPSCNTNSPRHAALIIGYIRAKKVTPPSSEKKTHAEYQLNGITHYIVHDDELGPYYLLPTVESASSLESNSVVDELPRQTPYKMDQVDAYIVPLPWKIYMRAENAIQIFEEMLPRVIQDMYSEEAKKTLHAKLSQGKIQYRLLIIESEVLKRWIYTDSKMPLGLQILYRFTDLPKFVWYIEIVDTTLDGLNNVCGEIVLDPTKKGYDVPWLTLHLPGEFSMQWVSSKTHDRRPVPNDTSHASLQIGISL